MHSSFHLLCICIAFLSFSLSLCLKRELLHRKVRYDSNNNYYCCYYCNDMLPRVDGVTCINISLTILQLFKMKTEIPDTNRELFNDDMYMDIHQNM